MRNCLSAALLGLLLFATGCVTRPLPTDAFPDKADRSIEMGMRFTLTPGKATRKMGFTTLLPQTIARRQRVNHVVYSIEPNEIFERDGNRYASFLFDKPAKPVTIDIRIAMDLYRYDRSTAERYLLPPRLDTEPSLKPYLAAEPGLEVNNTKLTAIAGEIERADQASLARAIFDYVMSHMRYEGYVPREQGALATFESQQGDCTDYTDLLVSLCRSRQIPARHVRGFVLPFKSTPKHSWAEIYDQKLGWVPYDPLHTDQRAARFDKLKSSYIYLTTLRRDPNLLGKYQFWFFRYWGDRIQATDTYTFKDVPKAHTKTIAVK